MRLLNFSFFLSIFLFFSGSQLFAGKKELESNNKNNNHNNNRTITEKAGGKADWAFQGCHILSGAWLWRPRFALELLVLDLHSILTPDGNNYLLA